MIAERQRNEYEDPVCHMTVSGRNDILPVTLGDRTYYFCAQACRDAFVSDPEKYLKGQQPKKKGIWGRYLERLTKATGGKTPPCCH